MKWLTLFFALLFALPAFAQGTSAPAPSQNVTGPASSMTPPPGDRAKQWLGLVDDKNYNDAYKQMSAAAQRKTASLSWAQKTGAVREPLGAMASRTIKTIALTKILPGMRDGQNATVQFDSNFAHKTAAVETITLTSEKGGWSVTDYAIK